MTARRETGRGRTGAMLKEISCLLVLCALSASASGAEPAAAKVTPQNISALYIGDLLRTARPREDLEAAASAQQPTRVTHHHYDHHYDHHHSPTPQTHHSRPEGRSKYVPVDAQTNVPVVGRFLSLRPVRFVSQEEPQQHHHKSSVGRSQEQPKSPRDYHHHQASPDAHHERDDCPKDGDHSHEEGHQYATPEERQYRREKQLDYHGSSEEDDRSVEHSSYTEPHRSTYNSKTFPSDTRSQSKSGSTYSQSKSSSTSKTMTPKRVKQAFTIVPKKFSEEEFQKPTANPADQGRHLVVYKVKDPKDRKRGGHHHHPKEYAPEGYEEGERTTPYSQYPEGQRKRPTGGPASYGHEDPQGPKQYQGYESDTGSYEQSPYGPERPYQATEGQYPDYPTSSSPTKPTQQTQYQNYKDQGNRYEVRPSKNTRNAMTHAGHERVSYKKGTTPSSYAYSYANDQRPQVSEKPQDYRGYGSQGTTPGYPASHQIARPVQESDVLLQPVHSRHRNLEGRRRKQFHESQPRFARSSGQYSSATSPTASAEESSVQPVNSPAATMVSGQVSTSVSYSTSGDHPVDDQRVEGRRGMPVHAVKPVAYKPYNSEYPASYANDPLHRSSARESRHYRGGPRSYERQGSYEDEDASEGHRDGDDEDEERPYDGGDDSYEQQREEGGKKDKSGHHYVSNIEGYRDEYHSDVPLHLDDAFFEKYGISKKAKIIVASAVDPHLLVADGSKVPEGGYKGGDGGPPSDDGYTVSEEEDDRRYVASPEHQEDHQQQPEDQHRPYQGGNGEGDSPEELGGFEPMKELPGSFDDLVDVNSKFLRKLPLIMSPGDSAFKSEAGFDDNDFHNVAHKGFVVSQGPREIVQQHGDGVSRIVFNVPRKEDDPFKMDADDGALLSAASALLSEIVKSSESS